MPLYAAAAGCALGAWYATGWDGPPWLWVGLCALGLAALLFGRADARLVAACALLAAFGLGGLRMDAALSEELRTLGNRGELGIEGLIVEQRSRTIYLVEVSAPAGGTVLVSGAHGSKLRPGDLVGLRGAAAPAAEQEPWERGLSEATGAALVLRSPRIALLEMGRGGEVRTALWALRARVSRILERHIPRESSPIAEGLLVGGSLRLAPETKAAFRASGTSHVLAASGYNVSVLAAMLLVVLRPLLGARRSLPPVLLAIAVYAGLAGFSASVVRAALMGGVAVVGLWLGRPRDGGRALAAAVLLMLLLDPHTVHDVGAQLSVAATAGLLWLLPLVERLLRLPGPLRAVVGVPLAAQLSTLPLSLYHFGGLSVWAVPANVTLAPLVPVGMLLAGLTLGGGALWYPLGETLGAVAGWVLGACAGIAELFAALPGAELQTDRLPALPVLLYYAAVAFALWHSRDTRGAAVLDASASR